MLNNQGDIYIKPGKIPLLPLYSTSHQPFASSFVTLNFEILFLMVTKKEEM